MNRGTRSLMSIGLESSCAADRAVSVAQAEAKLGTDVAGEAAGCGDHAGFNFHFLSLAVQLREQAVNSESLRECPR